MSVESLTIVEGYHNQIRHDVTSVVPSTRGTLLDLGGGIGMTAIHLKSTGVALKVGCIDQVPSDQAHPDLDFHHSGNLEDDQFLRSALASSGPFETILCLDVLEHLVDPWNVVRMLHDSLVPGGHIVVSIPNVRYFRVSGGLFLRGRWSLADSGILDRTHLRFFVKETAVELMTSSGLVLESIAAPQYAHRRRLRAVFRALTFGKLDGFINLQYLIRVRRVD